MSKKIALYLSIVGIFIIAFVLGLVAGGGFLKKTTGPTLAPPSVVEIPSKVEGKITSQQPVEAPGPVSIAEEKTLPAPVEMLPKIEERATATVVTEVQVPSEQKEKISKFEFQKGMVYVAWTGNGYSNPNSVGAMEQMASLGIKWVGIVTTWYQDKYNSTKIYPQWDKTPTDESLIFAIRKLRELKFKVMLKPHLDLVECEGKWRGEIGCDIVTDWQAWFDNYAAFLLHYADIAAKENVELLCIGTELANTTIGQPQRWRDLIKKIREVYKGQLTYAANWDTEFSEISFWDMLDYAAIDPYFPLICSSKPKVEELKSAWGDWIKTIEEWQQKINKPVIFTEIGYKSARDAADEPWQHTAVGELDLEVQVNLYKALLESFWDRPWFYGVYWWHWGTNPRMGGDLNRGFTPQNKPAQEVIKEWYSKPITGKKY